jgi:PAS domain S-box-containing protein
MNKPKINIRVLYVEDEAEMRESTAELLHRRFEYLDVASDGAEALEKLTNSPFDLLITDIRMPRMDGLELIYRLRENGIKTRCLIISAHNDTEFLMKAIEFGVEGYILKPIVRQRLLGEIERMANVILTEKELAQRNAELNDAHVLLTQVINSSHNVAMVVVDQQNKVSAYNRQFGNMIQNHRNHAVKNGMLLSEIFSSTPLDSAITYGIRQAVCDNPLIIDYELQSNSQAKNSYKVEFKSIKHPISKQKSVAAFFTDISSLKQNESSIESDNALLKSQQHIIKEELSNIQENYTQLFHNIYDGLLIINSSGNITEANTSFCDMSGLTANELIGHPFFNLFFPDDQSLRNPLLLIKELSNRTIHMLNGKLLTKKNLPLPVEVYTSKVTIKGSDNLLLIIHDANLKNKILTERNLLFQSLNKVNDSVLIANAQGIILFVNSSFIETNKVNEDEVLGKYFGDRVSGIREPSHCDEILANCKAKKIWTGVIKSNYNGGITQGHSLTVTPMFDTAGNLEFMIFVMHNITNEIIKERNTQHINKLETLSKVLNAKTHDFKNILMAISIYTELLQDASNLDENAQKYLRNIANENLRAQDLLRKIFTYRVCSKRPMPINIQAVINDTIESLRQSLPPSIKIEATITPVCEYPIEHEHIIQLLDNLISNAAQAIEAEGTIKIRLKTVDTVDNAPISKHEIAQWINLSIEDDGKGIDPSIAENIFDPLYTTKSKGNGLGLSLVLGLIINYEGIITFNPIIPKGTRFDIFLPIAE